MVRKLKDNSGASIMVGLLFFLMCAVIGSVILAAATAAAGRLTNIQNDEADSYAVNSAVIFLKDEINEKRVSLYDFEGAIGVYTYNEEPDSDLKDAIKTAMENVVSTENEYKETDINLTVDGKTVKFDFTMNADYSIDIKAYCNDSSLMLKMQSGVSQDKKEDKVIKDGNTVSRYTTTVTWMNPEIKQ